MRAISSAKRERLDQVVVGAAVEALDAVVECVAGGQDQHARIGPALPQRAQDLEAVPSRQRQIEQHNVEGLGADAEEGILAGRRHRHVVALAHEALTQRVGDLLLVLDNENRTCTHV
jgi:hypothetical protein